jgi:hypothetical protein
MFRHGVSGLTATRWVTFPMLQHTFWQVRPGGSFTSKEVSNVTPLAFGVKLVKFGRLLFATYCRGYLIVTPLRG